MCVFWSVFVCVHKSVCVCACFRVYASCVRQYVCSHMFECVCVTVCVCI